MFLKLYAKLKLKTEILKEEIIDDLKNKKLLTVAMKEVLKTVYALMFDTLEFFLIVFQKPEKRQSLKKSGKAVGVGWQGLKGRFDYYTAHRTPKQKKRLFISTSFSSFVALVLILAIVLSISPINIKYAEAASYNWTQSSWSGGATANYPTHTSNQSNWTESSSADSFFDTASGLKHSLRSGSFDQSSWSTATGTTATHASNQTGFTDTTSIASGIDYTGTPGSLKLTSPYATTGPALISSPFNTSDSSNKINQIQWSETLGLITPSTQTSTADFNAVGSATSSTIVSGDSVKLAIDAGTGTIALDLSISGSGSNCSATGFGAAFTSWDNTTCTVTTTSATNTFSFTTITIPTGKILRALGTTALTLKATGDVNISGGTINLNGVNGVIGNGTSSGGTGGAGGAGGGAGGRGGYAASRSGVNGVSVGSGTGGYGASAAGGSCSAGGGGGNVGGGATGACSGGSGGASTVSEIAGSGGGGGGMNSSGVTSCYGAGGGGGGGGSLIIISGNNISNTGSIQAVGGSGGEKNSCAGGSGGGGSGGMIKLVAYNNITNSGSISVKGGTYLGTNTYAAGGGGGRIILQDTDATVSCVSGSTCIYSGGTSGASVVPSGSGTASVTGLTYIISGTYTSPKIDLGGTKAFDTISWGETVTGQTGSTPVSIKVRSCDDADCSSAGVVDESVTKPFSSITQTACTSGCTIGNGGSLSSLTQSITNGDQYVQYEVTLTTSSTTITPSLDSITINHSAYPVVNDVRVQLQTSADGSTWGSDWYGPDGGTTTYWNSANTTAGGCTGSGTITCTTIPSSLTDSSNDQYFRYKITLISGDGTDTPQVDQIIVSYRNGPQALTSSAFNTTDSTAVFNSFTWNEDASLPSGSNIQFQLQTATNNDNSTPSDSTDDSPNIWTGWKGPDGTNTDWFESSDVTNCSKVSTAVTCNIATSLPALFATGGVSDQWLQYKVKLTPSTNYASTPTLTNTVLNYVVNAAPSVSTGLTASRVTDTGSANYDKILLNYGILDPDAVSGSKVTTSFTYSTNGSSWSSIAAGSLSGITDEDSGTAGIQQNVATTQTTYSNVVWDYKNELANVNNNYYIKVTIDDGEGANNTASDAIDDPTIALNSVNPSFDPSFGNSGVSAVQNSDGTVTIQYKIRDVNLDDNDVSHSGVVTPSFSYSTNGGTGWTSITAGLASGDTDNKTVAEIAYNTYSATWTPTAQAAVDGNYYSLAGGQFMIRVGIQDSSSKSAVTQSSAALMLDAKDPAISGTATVDASTSTATVTLPTSYVTDDNNLSMKLGLASDLSDISSWTACTSTTVPVVTTCPASQTISLATDPDTIYVQFRDAYNNTSAIIPAVSPQTPTALAVQDVSNVRLATPDYKEFLSWEASTSPVFAKYIVLKSTDNITFNTLTEITSSAAENYYTDSSMTYNVPYWYKIKMQDSAGDVSYNSTSLKARANAIQDFDEGGGGPAGAADTTAPQRFEKAPSGVQSNTTTSVDLTFTTDEAATCGYSTSSAATSADNDAAVTYYNTLTVFSSDASAVTAHTQSLSVSAGNSYSRYIRCKDANGNANLDDYQISFSVASADTTAPVRSTYSPTTGTNFASDTTSVVLSLATDETATCKYDTTDAVYGTLANTFSNTNSTVHTTTLSSLTLGDYTYYIRCQDGSSNPNTTSDTITFSIVASDTGAPQRSDGTVAGETSGATLASSTTSVTLALTTDETATCKYSTTASTAYGSMTDTFSTTAATSHSTSVTVAAGNSYTYYVRCTDGTNPNTTDFPLSFTVSAADVTAPVRSNYIPATSAAFASSTTSVTIGVSTDENATCKYDITDQAYADMTGTFTTSDSQAHYKAVSVSADTSYTYYILCRDTAGNINSSSTSLTFTIAATDVTSPQRYNGYPTSETSIGSSTTTQTISLTTNENANCKYDTTSTTYDLMANAFVTTGGTLHSSDVSVSAGSTYIFNVKCQDTTAALNTNITDYQISFSVASADTTAPVRSNYSPTSTLVTFGTGTSSAMMVLTTDENATCRYNLTDVAYGLMDSNNTFAGSGGKTHSASITTTDGSTYTYKIRCSDTVGNLNSSSDTVTFAVAQGDVSMPQRFDRAPALNDILASSTTAQTIGLTTDENATCQYSTVSGTAYDDPSMTAFTTTGEKTHSVSVTVAAGGSYSYYVRCSDGTNANDSDYQIAFTVASADVTPPTRSNYSPSDNTGFDSATTSVTLTLATDENATCKYGTSDVAYASLTSTFSGGGSQAHSADITVTSGTSYTYYIRCQDTAGNPNTTSDSITFSTSSGDVTPPQRFDRAPALNTVLASSTTSETISLTTDENATCKYGTVSDTAYASIASTFTTTGTTTHSASVSVSAGNSYSYYVRCTDGRYANDDDYQIVFSVASADTTAPVRSNYTPTSGATFAAGTTSITITLATDETATCKYDTSSSATYSGMASTFSKTTPTAHTATVTSLTAGSYNYYVKCQDANGNTNSSNDLIDFSIAIADSTAPQRFEGSPSGTLVNTATSATLSVTTDEAATCKYSTTAGTAYSAMTDNLSGSVTSHTATVSSLTAGSTYSYYVRCTDGTNVNDDDYLITFSVASADTTAPVRSNYSPISGSTFASGTTSVTLSLATDETATCKYDTAADVVYGGMSSTFTNTSSTAHSQTLTGLTAGTYSYYVRCQDSSSNVNADNTGLISFTIAPGDTTAPQRFEGAPTGSLANTTTSTTLSLTTDENATCKYSETSGTAYASMTATFSGSGTTDHTSTVSSLVAGSTYSYYVRCSDGTNVNGSDYIISFSVDSYDTTEPFRFNYSPVDGTIFASTTTSVTGMLTTDEAAFCRASLVSGQAFSVMTPLTYGGTTATFSHYQTITGLVAGNSYTYYIKCRDVYGNTNLLDGDIIFSIALGDVGAPQRFEGSPSGTLASSTTSTTLSLTTDEAATCRYSTTSNTAYSSMTDLISTNLTTNHSTAISSLSAGNNYLYYVRCRDSAGNVNNDDYQISFSIASSDATAPVRSNYSPVAGTTFDSTTTSVVLSLATNENATCNYGTSDAAYSSLTSTFSGAASQTHSATVSVAANTSYTYYVRCQDSASNANSSSDTITFSVAAGDITAPQRFEGAPTNALASSTTSTTLSLTTDENATCKYGTVSNTAYGSIANTFTTTGTTAHSASVTVSAGNSYSYYVRCTDGINVNTDDYQISFSITSADTTAPVRSNLLPASGTVFASTTSQVILSLTTDEIATCKYSTTADVAYGSMTNSFDNVNTLAHTKTVTGLATGTTYNYYVRCSDAAGNVNTDNTGLISFAIAAGDNTPPQRFEGSPTGALASSTTSVTLSLTTDETATCKYSTIASTAYASQTAFTTTSSTTHSTTISGLTSGSSYSYYVRCQDTAGNANTDDYQISFSITSSDTTAPVRSNYSPTTGTTFDYTTTQVTLSLATDEAATCKYSTTSGTAYASMSNTLTTTGSTAHSMVISSLTAGSSYSYYVRCQDTAGNSNTDDGTVSFSVASGDTNSYIISNVASSVTTQTATITWITGGLSNSNVEYSTDTAYDNSATVASYVTNHSVVLSGLSPNTTYNFRVNSVNALSATNSGTGYTFTTTDGPVIARVVANNITNTTADISWDTVNDTGSTTGVSASGYVVYDVTTPPSTNQAGSATASSTHSVTLTGLTPETTYYFYVKSSADSGTTWAYDYNPVNGALQYYTFTTTTDTAAPTISAISSTPAAENALVEWLTNKKATSKIKYWLTSATEPADSDTTAWTTLDSDFETAHTVLISTLAQETGYSYKVVSTDANSNSTTSSTNTFTTIKADRTAPTITFSPSTNVTSITTQSATISWTTTNDPSTTVLEYGTTAGVTCSASVNNYASISSSDTYSTSHSVVLTGLTPATAYYFCLQSTDPAGNVGTASGSTYTFTTTAGSRITAVTSTATETSVTITWNTTPAYNPSSDTSTVYYSTDSAFTAPAATSVAATISTDGLTHTATISNLNRLTTYYYYVASTSGSQTTTDRNLPTGYYFFVTQDDSTPPTISSVTTTPTLDNCLISWTTSEPTTAQIQYYTTVEVERGLTTTLDTDMEMFHNQTLVNLTSGTTYYFDIIAQDAVNDAVRQSGSCTTTAAAVQSETGGSIIISIPAPSAGVSETKAEVVDLAPPVITNVSSQFTSDGMIITWQTDEMSDSFVEYGETKKYQELGLGKRDDKEVGHKVILPLINFKAGLYHYRVSSRDLKGNLGRSDDYVFNITNGKQTEVINEVKATEAAKSTSVTGAISATIQNMRDFLGSYLQKITLNAPDKPITTEDVAQLLEQAKVFSPAPIIISDRPEITTTIDSVTIKWQTDTEANSIIDYIEVAKFDEKNPKFGTQTGDTANFVTNHEVVVTDLMPNTAYYMRIRSQNKAGVEAKSEKFIVVTKEEGLKVLKFNIIAGETSLMVEWTTNILSDSLVSYAPIKDGKKVVEESQTKGDPNMALNHKITLDNLAMDTTYALAVGGTSSKGESVLIDIGNKRTSLDTTPPQVSRIKVDQAVYPKLNKVQTIISWSTDEMSTSRVVYWEGIKEPETPIVKENKDLTTNHIITLTTLKPGAVYGMRVESEDVAGQITKSASTAILTPKQQQGVVQLIIKNIEDIFGIGKR